MAIVDPPKLVITHSGGTETDLAINTGLLQSPFKAVYADAHDAANAWQARNQYAPDVLNHYSGTQYYIDRAGIVFNVSPSLAGITAATVKLYCVDLYTGDGAFNVVIVTGDNLGDTLVVADYGDLLTATTSFGSIAATSLIVNAYNDIALNSDGLTALTNAVSSGKFRIGLRHSKDIDNIAGTGELSTAYFDKSAPTRPRFHFQIIG